MSPRPHRKALNIPGHAHELTFCCYRRYPFLARDRVRSWLADAIHEARREHDLALWAYVFMPDHVHLLVFPRQQVYDMSAILSAIKEPVSRRAVRYLARHAPDWLGRITRQRGQRTEHVFWQSGGGYDRNIDNPRTLGSIIDYIHNNPVRKGLVGRTIDWTWSSATWHKTRAPGPIDVDPIEW